MDGLKVAVLDDYQDVASTFADWSRLPARVAFFSDHVVTHEALVDRLAGFDVIVAMRERTAFGRSLLEKLPRLRLLVTTGMGNASIDMKAAADLDISVCGTTSPGAGTAELTIALMLALARNLIPEVDSVRSGGWQTTVGRDLAGTTLGVVGLGKQGSQVARLGLAFGMEVIAWSGNLSDERAREVGAARVTKNDLLARSDFVTIHVRLSDRTRGLIAASDLALMKPTAYLINTSRGPIVDEEALLASLDAGAIAGAGIDVFDPEPLALSHPYRRHPRVVATPHIGYVTQDTYHMFFAEAVEDIERWLAGKPVRVLNA